MRFETISTTDLLKYALESMHNTVPKSAEDEYLLDEQIAELEDTLMSISKGTSLSRLKKLKIGTKFGDWYYQKYEDREEGCVVYSLYDSSGEYVNEFLGVGDMREYIHKLYYAKAQ